MGALFWVQNICMFLSGTGVFLFGLHIMSDGLREASQKHSYKLFKTADRPVRGAIIGSAVTAAVHSSSAVTAVAISLADAGIISLTGAANIIIGANIGTTATGLLVALNSLNLSAFLMMPAIIGVILMSATKHPGLRMAGRIVAAAGVLFAGLSAAAVAADQLKNAPFMAALFANNNPVLLMLAGLILSAAIQSSTAVNGIVLAMTVPYGLPGLNIIGALYITLGTNVGTCITALFAAAGGGVNAKRAALIHLIFNVFGTTLFMLFLPLIPRLALASALAKLFGSSPAFQIAWFNFFQNLICACIALPLVPLIIKTTTCLTQKKRAKSH